VRRRALAAAAAIALLAAVAWLLLGRRDVAPGLAFRAVSRDAGSPNDGDEDRAMSLALASAPAPERRRIIELMDYTAARLETRLSPLGDDFGEGEGDPVEHFRKEMVRYAPSFTAARALVREAWSSPELEVRVVASCREAAGVTCVALWGTSSDALAERARFLAWPASRAAVVDLGAREPALACAAQLREDVPIASSAIALVLTADDLALKEVPERRELKDAARRLGRAMAANEIEDKEHLEAFARAAPSGDAAAWLGAKPGYVVVVPRLSALVRVAELGTAIDARPACARGRWVHRP
jgi:hypothetical protein